MNISGTRIVTLDGPVNVVGGPESFGILHLVQASGKRTQTQVSWIF